MQYADLLVYVPICRHMFLTKKFVFSHSLSPACLCFLELRDSYHIFSITSYVLFYITFYRKIPSVVQSGLQACCRFSLRYKSSINFLLSDSFELQNVFSSITSLPPLNFLHTCRLLFFLFKLVIYGLPWLQFGNMDFLSGRNGWSITWSG
jgi:hypothetical protein